MATAGKFPIAFKPKKNQKKNVNMGDQAPNEAGIQAEQPQVVEEPNKAGAHKLPPCTAVHGSTDTHSELPSSTNWKIPL